MGVRFEEKVLVVTTGCTGRFIGGYGVRSLYVERRSRSRPYTAAVELTGITGNGTSVQRHRAVVADTAAAFHLRFIACDGNMVERCYSVLGIEETTAAFRSSLVLTDVIGDCTSGHGQRTVIVDTATSVFSDIAGDDDVGQRGCTVFVDECATTTSPSAGKGTVAKVQRGTLTHGNDLTSTFATFGELTIQLMTVQVYRHRMVRRNGECTVTQIDVCTQLDVRIIDLNRCTNLSIGCNDGWILRPSKSR